MDYHSYYSSHCHSITWKPVAGYLINACLVLVTLMSVKYFGHYRVPMTFTAIITYLIIYGWIKPSGLIYSSNMSILHMYLLAAIWADKRYGWLAIFSNLGLFFFIYYQTLNSRLNLDLERSLGSPLYALTMHCLITIFFGGFLAYLQMDQERDQMKIRGLQERKISLLDEAVKKRTDQLNTMRETIATDFHDETGNMLSAITRQASLLRNKLGGVHEADAIVESIIRNSNALYASSKDFLWHLNHDSDNPQELLNYLTGYGQVYYNQFDIAFSSTSDQCAPVQLAPTAALNIIYIFKEAMTNVVKHADANEVVFNMHCSQEGIHFKLWDNGTWKAPAERQPHYGLINMERRCSKNGFGLNLTQDDAGTSVEILIPINTPANQES